MKHIGNELNIILSKNKKIRKKEFAEKIGMTDVNLSKIFRKDSIDSALLEKISKILNIPITFWFYEDYYLNIAQIGKSNIVENQKPSADTKESISMSQEIFEQITLLTQIIQSQQQTALNQQEIVLTQQQTVSSQQQTIDYLCKKIPLTTAEGA